MSITLTKENFVEMLPILYKLLDDKQITFYKDPDETRAEVSSSQVDTMHENQEFVTVPEEAYESEEAFLKFINENA